MSQAELDNLPKPHNKEFAYDKDPSMPGAKMVPRGVGRCLDLYDYLRRQAGHRDGDGPNAETVKQLSVPPVSQQPAELHATVPINAGAKLPFRAALPRLKNFAASFCRAPKSIYVDMTFFDPSLPYAFSPSDEEDAVELMNGLGTCESRLFRRLIEVIQAGQGGQITADWLRMLVADYTPRTTNPGRSTPRKGDDGGGGGPPADPDHDRVWDRIGIPKK